MEFSSYAGLSSERLASLRDLDIRRKSVYNGSNFSYGNNIYEVLHNCCTEELKNEEDTIGVDPFGNRYAPKSGSHRDRRNCDYNYAGLRSEIKNSINVRNRRIKSDLNIHGGEGVKDTIQHNAGEEEMNNPKHFLSDKGYVLTPKRCLARHVDDSEIDKYFSTKYAVTDKSSGRTEIMVERKPGCSHIIVQNFSEFDAYATYKRQDERKKDRDSFVHTKMGIVPKDGTPTDDNKCKARAMFTEVHRSDNIAPENYWLCPTVDSERKKKKKNFCLNFGVIYV
ncbi:Uncharacterized protein PCOAH_00053820 [Plasmodium coatneyi]|uniref:Subpellicular microtubule protein 2 n=1 Tax=Plasmodium coatneyi TaxID=208452 RepID=A0A1B1E7Z4_9APIC|nr:Uncharacterized protein PCOAH_00053820 [Plasmodium coatneyi]ANQ11162.1 Uncharacterized protein PCOAH_00053820 [Plasmodium coatneyi]